MRGPYSQSERICDACGESFWGTEAALYCSKPCRQRSYRARQAWMGLGTAELPALCAEITARGERGGASYSKLLPRLFRAAAAELRKRGWDPIELLMTRPDEPASEKDTAPGGIEGKPPERRRWLFPPEAELEKLEAIIKERLSRGLSVAWHLERREQITEYLIVRNANDLHAKAAP